MPVVAGARVVTPAGVLDPGWIEIDGEWISRTGPGAPPRPPDADLTGSIAVPGFVDMHLHGGGGAAFTTGSAEAAARALLFHRRHGTTTAVASLVSAPAAVLRAQLDALSGLVDDGELAGVHLEGPYLAAARCGAHDPAVLRPPDRVELARLLAAAGGIVRMVTVAPELDGALDGIRQVVGAGAVAAIGHTDAAYDTARAAVEAGATVATHLFNAMPPLHHRQPGAAVALLGDDRVTAEIVCDGAHLHPAVIDMAARAAGADRVALVTDATEAAGMPDGEYTLAGRPVRVERGTARLAGGAALAGSTLTADAALRQAVRQAGIPLEVAARLAAAVPARALGIPDVGEIAPGYRADVVVLDADLRVRRVLARGRWVEEAGGGAC